MMHTLAARSIAGGASHQERGRHRLVLSSATTTDARVRATALSRLSRSPACARARAAAARAVRANRGVISWRNLSRREQTSADRVVP